MLTDTGEERYGRKGKGRSYDGYEDESTGSTLGSVLFGVLFVGVLGWIIYSAIYGNRLGPGNNPGGRFPWGGGGGGWGGGGDEPPPPYSRNPPPSGRKSYPSAGGTGAQGWRPGFWTGAAAGAAGAYLAGNRGQQQRPSNTRGWNFGSDDLGEGSSMRRTRSSASSSFSSSRHQSSGFGSTSRR